eukprot:8971234-Alexandrium_andersonii.AAC.1
MEPSQGSGGCGLAAQSDTVEESLQPQPAEHSDVAQVPAAGADAGQAEAPMEPAAPMPAAAQAVVEAATTHHPSETAMPAASGGTGAAEDMYDPWEQAP